MGPDAADELGLRFHATLPHVAALGGSTKQAMEVFLLWHIHPIDGDVNEKLIGVYSTQELAREAASRLARAPGFVDLPHLVADDDGPGGFLISQATLDEDQWTEGYVTEAGGQGDAEPE